MTRPSALNCRDCIGQKPPEFGALFFQRPSAASPPKAPSRRIWPSSCRKVASLIPCRRHTPTVFAPACMRISFGRKQDVESSRDLVPVGCCQIAMGKLFRPVLSDVSDEIVTRGAIWACVAARARTGARSRHARLEPHDLRRPLWSATGHGGQRWPLCSCVSRCSGFRILSMVTTISAFGACSKIRISGKVSPFFNPCFSPMSMT